MPGFEARLMTLLAKTEVTYAVDPVPTGGANAIMAKNIRFRPMEGKDVSRDIERPYLGAQQQFPTGLHAGITFETELVGNAAVGTAPAWGVLARACGLAQVLSAGVSATYNPISENMESATLYFYGEDKLFKLRGTRGGATLKLNADQLPVIEWTMMGLWDQPSDVATAVPTFTPWNEPQVVNDTNTPTFTINGVSCTMRNFELALGNSVAFRALVNYEEVRIGDRRESVRTQVDAVALATLDPFTLARNQTAFAVNLVHGVGAGKVVTLNLPSCRLQRPDSSASPDGIVEWPMTITPLPVAGNDQFTLTLT